MLLTFLKKYIVLFSLFYAICKGNDICTLFFSIYAPCLFQSIETLFQIFYGGFTFPIYLRRDFFSVPEALFGPSVGQKIEKKKIATSCYDIWYTKLYSQHAEKANVIYVKSQVWTPQEILSYFICWQNCKSCGNCNLSVALKF